MNDTGARPAQVLVVDDEPLNVDLLEQELAGEGYEVLSAGSGSSAIRLAVNRQPDLILLDIMMPGMDGIEVCRRLKFDDATKDIPVIFTTALADLEHKLEAFEAGGVDYLTKPFRIEEVLARVGAHVALVRARRELERSNQQLRAEIEAHARSRDTIRSLVEEIEAEHSFEELIGASGGLAPLVEQLDLVAETETTVLILGETGTGKELIARAIHRRSARNGQPLVKVNCAALPRELVESELFGHEKGAFTGATTQRRGRFELADGGTIFLDEIGELPLDGQVKLLRVLQEQEFERVGGTATMRTDVRVIAATNRDLADEVDAGRFRADLYYRLNVFPVTVPPLRERPEDIAVLVQHFVATTERRIGRGFEQVSQQFLRAVQAYDWPGNVRELENVIERSAIRSKGETLELAAPLKSNTTTAADTAVNDTAGPTPNRTLAEMERSYIETVLASTDWQIEGERGAAAIVGLNPSTLRGRMRKLGIRKQKSEDRGQKRR